MILATTITTSNSINLECDFVVSEWNAVGEILSCYGRKMNVQVPGLEIETVNNETEILDDMVGFWVFNEVVNYVPRGIAKFMPNLEAFGMGRTGLLSFTKLDLAPFPNIRRLAIYSNHILYLERDLFIYNPKLESVTLYDNYLMIVGETILEPLPLLDWVEIEFKCYKENCEDKECIQLMTENLKTNCQSDIVIQEFKEQIQKLEAEMEAMSKKLDSSDEITKEACSC